MVDMNLFQGSDADGRLLLIPELRGLIQSDVRHVIRINVDRPAGAPRVFVEHVTTDEPAERRRQHISSVEEFVAKSSESSADASIVQRMVQTMQDLAAASGGALVFEFKTGADLYWVTPEGRERRVLAFRTSRRLRVWLDYLTKGGHEEIAGEIRELSQPLVTFNARDKSGTVFVNAGNEDAMIDLVRSIANLLVASKTNGTSEI